MFKTLITVACVTIASAATAQNSGLPVKGELMQGWREANGQYITGVSLSLVRGWKTYWRVPGEGGIPPRFNWSGSQNVAAVEVRYPVPKVMEQQGLVSIGYDEDVIFPLIVTTKNEQSPVTLKTELEIGVCEEVCIPVTLRLSAVLPPNGKFNPRIGDSLENRPLTAGSFNCEIEPISDGVRLRASTKHAKIPADIVVIETATPDAWVSPSITTQNGHMLNAEVEIVPPSARPFALARSGVRMTLIGSGRAIEMTGCS